MITRRRFLALAQALGLSTIFPAATSSCTSRKEITGSILGANASLGHRLRTMDFGKTVETIQTDVVIVGGGASGLSAARYLKKNNTDFLLLELADNVGGNAMGGMNAVSKFPWGAHYLPIPGNSDPELIAFLSEADVITGIQNGLPVYNEYYLCHDPKERLFINNYWQEGIVPHAGIPKTDRDEIERFLEMMHAYKNRTGSDGKPAFSIPVELSSQDGELLALDSISAQDFLRQHNFKSPYLNWYVNYCCADDFGSSIEQTSAWAMVHYFASRNGRASNTASDAVLTWPEGNQWLIQQLQKSSSKNISSNAMVYQVSMKDNGVSCIYFDAIENVSKEIICEKVILATPQFINQRILSGAERTIDYGKFEYAPWMVANFVTDHRFNEKKGEGLCWDNVIYGSDSLGYVNASHQDVSVHQGKRVMTYYKPLLNSSVGEARKFAYQASYEDWRSLVLNELKKPHPELEHHIEELNVWLWGHGMVRPGKNFVWSDNRVSASKPIANKIFFAHSDLSGLSIFEEAFYQGHKAAKMVLES